MTTYVFYVGRHILFSVFILIAWETIHTYVWCPWSVKLTALNILQAIFVLSHLWFLNIPPLAVIFVLANFLLQFINISIWQPYLFFSHLWPHMDSLFGRNTSFSFFMPISWSCTHVYIYQKTNSHKALHWQPQIFYICKLYLFLYIYEPFNISCLVVTFVFYKCLWSFYCNS